MFWIFLKYKVRICSWGFWFFVNIDVIYFIDKNWKENEDLRGWNNIWNVVLSEGWFFWWIKICIVLVDDLIVK